MGMFPAAAGIVLINFGFNLALTMSGLGGAVGRGLRHRTTFLACRRRQYALAVMAAGFMKPSALPIRRRHDR